MRRKISLGLTLALLATLLIGGSATASDDGLVGTWHQRDAGTSNIFYFVDEPVGDVYPILFYDDFTSEVVCGDNGPMLWSGFVTETSVDETTTTFMGTFGTYWCPDNGDGVHENLLNLEFFGITLEYDSATDTISGGIGGCEGTRQPKLDSPNEAAEEISEGKYPPPGPPGC
jgi:hypothetical protein